MTSVIAIASLGVRGFGYLALAWFVADTLRRAVGQLRSGPRAGAVVCLVGTLAGAVAYVLAVGHDSDALDHLLTLR